MAFAEQISELKLLHHDQLSQDGLIIIDFSLLQI